MSQLPVLAVALAALLAGFGGQSDARADCGDGVVDADEACDLGDGNGPATPCTPLCTRHVCGDGILAWPEQCDDGNEVDADGCDRSCRSETAPLLTDSIDLAGPGGDAFHAIAQHENTFFVVGGGVEGWRREQPFLVAWDRDEGALWTKHPFADARTVTFHDVAVTDRGLIVAVGARHAEPFQQWIGVYTREGGTIDQRTLNPSEKGELRAVVATDDGDVIIGGWINELLQDQWIARFDPRHLELEWTTQLPHEHRGDIIDDLAIGADGTIAAAGTLRQSTLGERWVGVLDPGGMLRWETHDSGTAGHFASADAIALGPDGEVYAAGQQQLTTWDEEDLDRPFEYDVWISRFEDGEELWRVREDWAGPEREQIGGLAVDESGTLLVTGSAPTQPLLTQAEWDRDAFLMTFDRDGNRLWTATYDGPMHTADAIEDVLIAGARVLVAGSTTTPFEGGNAWIAEYDIPAPVASTRPPAPPVDVTEAADIVAGDDFVTGPGTLYLNFLGGTLHPGTRSDRSEVSCLESSLVYPGFAVDEAFILAVVERVEAGLADFDIEVVWEHPPPSHVPYTMVMIGGHAEQLGLPAEAAGYACTIDCFDASKRDTAFVFASENPGSVAINVLHEAAHTWGLDHVEGLLRIMSPFTHGAQPEWGSGCAPLSDATSKSHCSAAHRQFCDRPNEQDSHAEMLALFGSRTPDTSPPSARFVGPETSDITPAGEPVVIDIEVFDDHPNTGWAIEVPALSIRTVGEGERAQLELALPPGGHEVVLTATDQQGNETVERTIVAVEGDGVVPPQASTPSEVNDDDDDGNAQLPGASEGGCHIGGPPPPSWLFLGILVLPWMRLRT